MKTMSLLVLTLLTYEIALCDQSTPTSNTTSFVDKIKTLVETDSSKKTPQYPDEETSGFDSRVKERFATMRSFFLKQKPCTVAIHGMFSKYYKTSMQEAYLPKAVTCVGDIVMYAGTMKEIKGCALATYNPMKGQYGAFFNDYYPQAVSKKDCNSGGFEDLMQKVGTWSPEAYRNTTVEQTIFTPVSDSEPWQYVLVYAESEKIKNWFLDARTKGTQFNTDKLNSKKPKQKTK